MSFRRLSILLGATAVYLSGCNHFFAHSQKNYRTVVAAPHRDQAQAIKANRRARKLLESCELQKAELALQDALIADVTYGPAHNNLGKVYQLQGKNYLAAWEYEYAIRLMPEAPEPYNNLGLVYESVDKLDQAIALYENAYRMQSNNPEFIGNLARARLKRDINDPQIRILLEELIFQDTRPEWVGWARELLAVGKLPDYRQSVRAYISDDGSQFPQTQKLPALPHESQAFDSQLRFNQPLIDPSAR